MANKRPKRRSSVSAGPPYVLRLYVVGKTRQSTQAIKNLKAICETFLKDSYDLTVIDLVERPECAQNDQVIVVPTLIRLLPLPLYRIIGDLSQTERVLSALDLPNTPHAPSFQ